MQTQQTRTPAEHPPNRANLRAWWSHFHFAQKTKKEGLGGPHRPLDIADHPVFGKSLKESLKYASVQISTADANGNLYVWGYIPVVVAKCGLYLKENATEVQGTFRVNGSTKRMRELQAAFESPPRYGKNLDWRQEYYTTHDVASVFRRYLTQMPEPVIPHDMYNLFRVALAKQPYNQEEAITTYKSLIRRMPKPNQYLLLYVLDLLSVFARKSDKNLMTATNLAVIFRPGLISHPQHERSPEEHNLSQRVLEFLIAQQDWFMLDISPPTPGELVENASTQGPGAIMGGGRLGNPSVRWPESTNTPTVSWKATVTSGLGDEVSARNPNPEAGPSTLRRRAASASAWPSGLPPHQTPPQIQSDLGQLTEQITPTSSVPSSPVQLHSDKPKMSPGLGQSSSSPDIGSTHGLIQQRRPSSPLNFSHLPSQANHPPSQSPPPLRPGSPGASLYSDVEELMVIPAGTEEEDTDSSFVPGSGGWKILGRNVGGGGLMEAAHGWGNMQPTGGAGGGHVGGFMSLGGSKKEKDKKEREDEKIKVMRRRTTMERSGVTPHGTIIPIEENPLDSDLTAGNRLSASTIQRSRTLPTRRIDKLLSAEDLASGAATDKENEKSGSGIWSRRRDKDKGKEKEKPKGLLRKHRPRPAGHVQAPSSSSTATNAGLLMNPISSSPVPSPGVHGNQTMGSPLALGKEKEPNIEESGS